MSREEITEEKNEAFEEMALELVSRVRKLHFQDGSAASARTKQLKEIIEKQVKKIHRNAS